MCPILIDTAHKTQDTGEEELLLEIEFRRDPDRREPKLIIVAADLTDEISDLLRQLEHGRPGAVTGFQEEQAVLLPPDGILRFFGDGKLVSAQTAQGVYTVRERLYELEEQLDPRRFVRISNSEIVNLSKVTALDLSITGTIRMTLEGETVCFVSRRYVKKIKQALGL